MMHILAIQNSCSLYFWTFSAIDSCLLYGIKRICKRRSTITRILGAKIYQDTIKEIKLRSLAINTKLIVESSFRILDSLLSKNICSDPSQLTISLFLLCLLTKVKFYRDYVLLSIHCYLLQYPVLT